MSKMYMKNNYSHFDVLVPIEIENGFFLMDLCGFLIDGRLGVCKNIDEM